MGRGEVCDYGTWGGDYGMCVTVGRGEECDCGTWGGV